MTMRDEYVEQDAIGHPLTDLALTRAFEAERARLLRVAYSIVGSLAEAEDCVQEAWLRLQRLNNPEEIRDLKAWLTTTVGRLALDTLGSARARRVHYVGTWLPEPLVEEVDGSDPAERVELDESVSMALMVILERLSAAERTAFLLHDVFGMSFDEVAAVVGRSLTSVRQLASRARQHVENGRPRFVPTQAEQRELVAAFAAACQEGNLEKLVTVLDPNVVWRSDSGGKVRSLHRFKQGSWKVARGLLAFASALQDARLAVVNGSPGLVLRDADNVLTVVSFTIDGNLIVAIDVIRNPDKLTKVRLPE